MDITVVIMGNFKFPNWDELLIDWNEWSLSSS